MAVSAVGGIDFTVKVTVTVTAMAVASAPPAEMR
jgi:hypothetical protein